MIVRSCGSGGRGISKVELNMGNLWSIVSKFDSCHLKHDPTSAKRYIIMVYTGIAIFGRTRMIGIDDLFDACLNDNFSAFIALFFSNAI